ncbi:hypothetical protein [Paracidovorax anthurii]|nr:hypothetical protein [Paracidovorax anthurii]
MRNAKIILGLLFSIGVAGPASAWTLVYSHDQSGAATFGSIQALVNAVSNGSGVKVVVETGETIQFQCNWLHVKKDVPTSPNVVCTAESGLGVNLTAGANFGGISSPPFIGHYAMNTLGQYAVTRITAGTSNVTLRQNYSFPMQWYVQ